MNDASHLEVVKTTHCESVHDFLNNLSPRGPLFGPTGLQKWLFRGHARDEHELVPAALRKTWRGFDEFLFPRTTNRDQIRAEIKVLGDFFETADSIGLSIPEDTQFVRRLFTKYARTLPASWPPKSLLSLMALAQHHGLPTRLLDWSRHPLKAAHFAAYEATNQHTFSGRLSVWAVLQLPDYPLPNCPITIVTAPGASNPNLHAQAGIFTFTGKVFADEQAPDSRPLVQVIRDWYHAENFRLGMTVLHHITLPQQHCIELSRELSREGVTRATLFPDLYGVVDTVRSKRRFLPSFPDTPE